MLCFDSAEESRICSERNLSMQTKVAWLSALRCFRNFQNKVRYTCSQTKRQNLKFSSGAWASSSWFGPSDDFSVKQRGKGHSNILGQEDFYRLEGASELNLKLNKHDHFWRQNYNLITDISQNLALLRWPPHRLQTRRLRLVRARMIRRRAILAVETTAQSVWISESRDTAIRGAENIWRMSSA